MSEGDEAVALTAEEIEKKLDGSLRAWHIAIAPPRLTRCSEGPVERKEEARREKENH